MDVIKTYIPKRYRNSKLPNGNTVGTLAGTASIIQVTQQSPDISVVQFTGTSQSDVMSQKAVTEIFNEIKGSFNYNIREDISSLIQEIYISGASDTDLLYVNLLSLNVATKNISIDICKYGVSVASIMLSDGVDRFGRVIELTENNNSGISGYVVFKYADFSGSGYPQSETLFTPKAYNVSYSKNIMAYLEQSIRQNNADTQQIEINTQKSGFVPSNSIINERVQNMFIGNAYRNSVYTTLGISFSPNTVDGEISLFIQRDGVTIGRCYVPDLTDWKTKVHGITFFGSNTEYGFMTFNDVADQSISGDVYELSDKVFDLSFSPIIEDYLISKIMVSSKQFDNIIKKPIYINNYIADSIISELYIPNASQYGTLHATTIVSKIENGDAMIVINFLKSDDTYVCHCQVDGFDGNQIFNVPIRLKKYDSYENLGWVIINNHVNYINSGINFEYDNSIISDINKSPTIKKLIENEDQVIMIGDSLIGIANQDNVLESFLMSKINKRVYNVGFGGCRMAWLTPDGSNNYDKFTAVSLSDSLISKNYTAQINANEALNNAHNYKIRIADLQEIDLTKPTTIVCNFINNDLTSNVPVGSLWQPGVDKTQFNKQTYLGAMNYFIANIAGAYSHIRFVFLTEAWRYKDDKNSVSVPPHLYVNTNDETSLQFRQAQFDNCYRIGVELVDFTTLCNRNAYNMEYMTNDGTHFNTNGYDVFAKMLSNYLNI